MGEGLLTTKVLDLPRPRAGLMDTQIQPESKSVILRLDNHVEVFGSPYELALFLAYYEDIYEQRERELQLDKTREQKLLSNDTIASIGLLPSFATSEEQKELTNGVKDSMGKAARVYKLKCQI